MKPFTRLALFLALLLLATSFAFVGGSPGAASAANAPILVTSSNCTGPGSFVEAVTLANDNPGHDTISFDPDLQIEASDVKCPPVGQGTSNYYIAQVTESVTIEGNGAKFKGRLGWVNTAGTYNPTKVCPKSVRSTVIVDTTPGFLKVGLFGQMNAGLTVEVKNLELFQFNAIAQVEKDASLVLEDFTAREIYSIKDCVREAINADEGASVTLRRNDWEKIYAWGLNGALPIPGVPVGPSISGGPDAGDLHIEDSRFRSGKEDGFIYWMGKSGSEVNIVTSTMERVKGIVVDGEARTRIVNSVFALDATQGNTEHEERIYNLSTQDMDIIASTFLFPNAICSSRCQTVIDLAAYKNYGLITPINGKINFQATAIGVAFPFEGVDNPGEILDLRYGLGKFTADNYTWIQPVLKQDSVQLKILTSQDLLTDPPGLPTAADNSAIADSWVPWATPLVPGILLDVIPNADCGSANKLINPIDGTCIVKDILGNSRWDTGNDKRNIGAVQLTLAPHLSVIGFGDGTVDLNWTKPNVLPSSTIKGYELRYKETGAATETPLYIDGPDSLTYQVTGLTNNKDYEFNVQAVYTDNSRGPNSNKVTATPYAPIDPPVVMATPGDREVQLFWTEPDAGGHPGPLVYTVIYRQVGTDLWVTGPREISARITLIPGLTNNKEYEFAVFATAIDGTVSELGKITATPDNPACPFVAGNLIENYCFEEGAGPWIFFTDGAGTYTTSTSNPYQGQFAANAQVRREGSNVQLYQKDLPLKPNTQYELSFAAYSSNANDLSVFVHEHDDDFTNYGLRNFRVNLGTGWKVYQTTFTTTGFNAPVDDARLRFWMAPFDVANMSYHIDWVVLREVDSGNPPIPPDPPVIVPPPGQCTPNPDNMIANPGFESGTSSWTFWTDGAGSFTTANSDPYECDNNAKVSISQPGDNVQLYQQPITLQGGVTYRLRLAARSNNGRDVSLFMHQHGAPYTNYGLNGVLLNLTPAWQVFVVEFTAKGNVQLNDARLRIWMAPFDASGTVYEFDDVVLLPAAAPTNLVSSPAVSADTLAMASALDRPTSGWVPASSVLIQGHFLDGDEQGRLEGGLVAKRNSANFCAAARPSRSQLLPANGRMAKVSIVGLGQVKNVTITSVTQDEAVGGPLPDAIVKGKSVWLRQERDEAGEGRVYTIAFTATNGSNQQCSYEVMVSVPVDRQTPAVDNGSVFDSTVASP